MAAVAFVDVGKRYGDAPVIENFDLAIADREFMVLVGPSGSGKSTALRMIAGLEDITSGTITIGGRPVNDIPPKDRDIAMVFQNYALYPHMTVRENLEFGLRLRKTPAPEIERLVAETAKLLGIDALLERRPRQLSGGERQRVALGRAIMRKPAVFLFDEPLSNLDAKLRVQMRAEISRLQKELGVTTIYVTHDQVEAMTMGDRVAVMKLGVLQQVDTPLKLYDKPANLFVAGFIGSPQMNLIKATAADGQAKIGTYLVPVDPTASKKMQGNITVGVRPEAWRLVSESEGGLPITVTVVEELGADSFVYGTCDVEGTPSNVIVRVSGRHHPQKGETLYVTTDPQHVHAFDTETGERLSD